MMKKKRESLRMDLNFSFGYSLFDSRRVRTLAEVLRKMLPTWSRTVQEWTGTTPGAVLDLSTPVALLERIRECGLYRGPVARQFEARYGPAAYPRMLGSLELRGSGDSIIVILQFDQHVVAPIGTNFHWGNTLALQVCEDQVEEMNAIKWSRKAFTDVCAVLSPAHAFGHMSEEFDAKNMSREGGGLRAVGVDISKALPGLYWINCFGKPYCDFIGREKLLSAPAKENFETPDGVGLVLDSDPKSWSTPEYRIRETQILNHIGEQYFFLKDFPDRKTVAPPLIREQQPKEGI